MLTLLNQLHRVLSIQAGNGDDKRERNDDDTGGKSKRRRVRFTEDPAEVFEIAPPSTNASQSVEVDDDLESVEESRSLDEEDEEAIREEVRESGFFVARGDDDDDETEESESVTLGSEQEEEDRGAVRLKTREVTYPRDLSKYELIIPKGKPKAKNRFVYNQELNQTVEEFFALEDIKEKEIVLYFGGELVFASQNNSMRHPIKEVPGLYLDWSDISRNVNDWQLGSFVPKVQKFNVNLQVASMKPIKGSRSLTYKTAVYLVATRPIFAGEKLYVLPE